MPLVKFVLLTWRSRMVLAPCVCAACEPGQRGSAVKPLYQEPQVRQDRAAEAWSPPSLQSTADKSSVWCCRLAQ